MADVESGSVVGGRYRVDEPLGEGGMARVFAATQIEVGTSVVVKIPKHLAPNTVGRFGREVQAIARLAHPAIVRLLDSGIDETFGVPFMVLERVYGEGLGEIVKARGPLPEDDVTRIIGQIASGLAAAHGQGVLHRDLKPNNVMLDQTGRARILDFGLAKLLEDDASPPLTRPATTLGTPQYMSPEQVAGKSLDGRSDLYALGCLAFYLMTGRAPFGGTNALEIMRAQLSRPAPPLEMPDGRQPSAELSVLVSQLLMKQPGKRPVDATVVAEALGADDVPPDPTVAPTTLTPTPEPKRDAPLPTYAVESVTPTQGTPTGPARIVIVGLVIATIAVAAYAFMGGPQRLPIEAPTAAPTKPELPAVPKPIAVAADVTIASVPTGAAVFRNGKRLGVTPLELRGSALPIDVELRLAGHENTRARAEKPGRLIVEMAQRTTQKRPRRAKPKSKGDDFEVPVW